MINSIDPDMLDKIARLREQGFSLSEIGDALNLSRNAVLGRLTRLNEKKALMAAGGGTVPVPPCRLISNDDDERGRHLDRLIWRGIERRRAAMQAGDR